MENRDHKIGNSHRFQSTNCCPDITILGEPMLREAVPEAVTEEVVEVSKGVWKEEIAEG